MSYSGRWFSIEYVTLRVEDGQFFLDPVSSAHLLLGVLLVIDHRHGLSLVLAACKSGEESKAKKDDDRTTSCVESKATAGFSHLPAR